MSSDTRKQEGLNRVELVKLLADLSACRLREGSKAKVVAAKFAMQMGWSLPLGAVMEILQIRKLYRAQLTELALSRERARLSIAKKKFGLTDGDIDVLVSDRLAKIRAGVEDLGF